MLPSMRCSSLLQETPIAISSSTAWTITANAFPTAVLFGFDELVNHNIISPKEAAAHLAELYECNVRLGTHSELFK